MEGLLSFCVVGVGLLERPDRIGKSVNAHTAGVEWAVRNSRPSFSSETFFAVPVAAHLLLDNPERVGFF